jgi:hypothetical protein
MNSWKVILATVIIFGAGVITGGLLVNHINDTRPDYADQPPSGPNAHATANNYGPARSPEVPLPRLTEKLSKDFVRRLDESLRLTPEQRAVIAKIVADGQERNHVIWTNVSPQMRKVIQDVNQQIRAELTPGQLKQFEELMKQRPPRRPSSTNASSNFAAPTNAASPASTNPPPGV